MLLNIKNGVIQMVYSDDLAGLLNEGSSTVTRASHVEPGVGGWYADLEPVQGPVLGPFTLRADALKAEVEWLERWHIAGSDDPFAEPSGTDPGSVDHLNYLLSLRKQSHAN